MKIYQRIEDYSDEKTPIILTIGNFDGLHRGHMSVLDQVKKLAGSDGKRVVLTFSNHPSEVLQPEEPVLWICSLEQRIRLFEENEIDELILIPFTRYLANHTAESFVERVREFIPFTQLVLGFDATLGKDRRGDKIVMEELGHNWAFGVQYMDEYRFEGRPISSSQIRELIKSGRLEFAEQLLGRPYSILAKYEHPNVDVSGLCLPPSGIYSAWIKLNDERFKGEVQIEDGKLKINKVDSDDSLLKSCIEVEIEFIVDEGF